MFTIKIGQRKHSLSTVFERYILAVLFAYTARLLFLTLPFNKKNRISLVGHRLNGNLKAFHEYLVNEQKVEVLFFTDDPAYYKSIKGSQLEVYSMQNLWHLKKLAGSKAVCTSHGPLSLSFWQNSKHRPLFFEVWHGAGFKNRKNGATQDWLFYDGVFVSSPTFKNFHRRWGYKEKQLFVTGYAQTDQIVHEPSVKEIKKIRTSFGINPNTNKKIVLYAPTWNTKDASAMSPYSMPINSFLKDMDSWAQKQNAIFLILPHINSSANLAHDLRNVMIVSESGELDIKPLLHVVDVLVTDWSSIYTDFLALPSFKPVVFLDTPPAFYGFTLTPDDRAGKIVSNQTDLTEALSKATTDPSTYIKKYSAKLETARKRVWGATLDGKSAERYYKIIREKLNDEK
jgi:CDP-glycerol glycerophosphotransferase (TagB/SpsB family)